MRREPEFSTFMDGYWKAPYYRKSKEKQLWDVIRFVESWVSNPASAYSTDALEGLFGMTRDKIGAL